MHLTKDRCTPDWAAFSCRPRFLLTGGDTILLTGGDTQGHISGFSLDTAAAADDNITKNAGRDCYLILATNCKVEEALDDFSGNLPPICR